MTQTKTRPDTFAEKAMSIGLRGLNRFAGSDLVDRLGLREPAERVLKGGTKHGFRAAGAAARTFTAAQKLAKPARQPLVKKAPDLFDITPSDEQAMLREAFADFGDSILRPAAHDADAAAAAPAEIMAQANELGLTTLGVPEELGGAVSERSAVTAVLAAEALSHGDMGVALAALAPAAVSTAIGLWGDADQQATYLHEFTGENVPAAALAIQEGRPLFDPFQLQTTARAADGGYVLDGVKALVPRAAEDELFVVAANLEGRGPALFIVESSTKGVFTEPEPAMGIRAAATSRLILDGVKLPQGALLGEGSPDVYADCIHLGRIGWSAMAVGTAQAVLDYVIPYVNDRIAFGEPISNRQSVAFAVADIAIELEGMRLLTYRAAGRVDHGKSYAREAALARRQVADKAYQIGSQGVQLLGGHGYTKEHPVERWYRDLRAAGIMEGALLV
jgi:alkylation response protein AidB-like acyl-CoA dehydrogenase